MIAQAANYNDSFSKTGEVESVNGDGYDITFYKKGVLRTAVVIENGEQNILQINDITGVMTLNGQMVENSTITLQQKT